MTTHINLQLGLGVGLLWCQTDAPHPDKRNSEGILWLWRPPLHLHRYAVCQGHVKVTAGTCITKFTREFMGNIKPKHN